MANPSIGYVLDKIAVIPECGGQSALSVQARAGYQMFTGEANCSRCHLLEEQNASLTDGKAHNTGIGYARSMKRHDQPHLVALANSMANLEQVIEFYSTGGLDNPWHSPLVEPLHLSDEQRSQLLAFLMALSSPDADKLVSNAKAAPVGDRVGDLLR